MATTDSSAGDDGRIKASALASSSRRRPRPGSFGPHLLLLAATLLSTTLIGMRYMHDFQHGMIPLASREDIFPYEWVWNNLGQFTDGLPFSLTLITILLAHEFGHYAACRFYSLEATLPFIFPAPTLSGTFGAVIRIRSQIKSRAALMALGASGPIAGFAVAVPTVYWGLIHSRPAINETLPSTLRIQGPTLMGLLRGLLLSTHPALPPLARMVPHPVLMASWIGLLITSLNLTPAGQLDGGHILYALSPRAHRISYPLVVALLLYLGTTEWAGWVLWAALLVLPGMRHPKVADTSRLSVRSMALALASILIFGLTACIQPSAGMSLFQLATHTYRPF